MFSKKWNVLQKSTFHLDSFWKRLKMECVDTFTLTRTLLLWRGHNSCVHKPIWLTWKIECRKWIFLIFAHEKEPIQSGKFYKLTNLTFFASLLKDVPMGCKETVLPEPLLKNHDVNCLTFERKTIKPYNYNLCLFRALALHLHGNEKPADETSKIFDLFLNNSEQGSVSNFQGVHLNVISKVEDLLQLNIFLHDFDFVDGELIGELCRRSTQKYEKKCQAFALQQLNLLRQ